MQVAVLNDAAATRRFYEGRYATGYMDRWEADRWQRLGDVLAAIDLPAGARVLDFGCGSGALTRLLLARWPDCEIHGADISATAVAHARERDRGAGARFHVLDAAFVRAHRGQFDFVFSHHVLEHVFDLDQTTTDIASLLARHGRMLHALPCGNPGSLPHWLCLQRPDGIDPAAGNRFFFEEASHLRRLRTEDLVQQFAVHGCTLHQASYGYHWWGALRLFTEMAPRELMALLQPRRCHPRSLPLVVPLLLLCLLLWAGRVPFQILVRCRRMLQQVFTFRTRRLVTPSCLALLLLALPALCLVPASALVEAGMRHADRSEWRRRRRDPRAAEMLLEFAR